MSDISLIPPDATLERLFQGCAFAEGPAAGGLLVGGPPPARHKAKPYRANPARPQR